MLFNTIGPAASGRPNQTTTTNPSATDVGSGQFMQLLLAQLRNQNPLDPVEDKDFMGQVTAMNSLQELQKMNTALQGLTKTNRLSEAAGLIGRVVQARAADGQTRSGLVTGVTLQNDRVMLWLGRDPVDLSDVIGVSA
ncbi:MAG: hypothetical protein HY260_05015 [Chloroflexi bacterium]|nr:hypothetical protein [Chloroflexota bacterium]